MEAARRVFAGEFNRSTGGEYSSHLPSGESIPLTPSGFSCARIFVVGALTDVEGGPGPMIRARVADPTGTFLLDIKRSDPLLSRTILTLTPPVFIAVTGEGRVYRDGTCVILPEAIAPTTRAIRDLWVMRTADMTLSRLEHLLGSSPAQREQSTMREIASMVKTAIDTVKTGPEGQILQDSRQVVMTLISEYSGPRGVPMDVLKEHALSRGVSGNELESIVDDLVEEGDCYQPLKGYVKLL